MMIQDVPLHCINQAAERFHVPAMIIVSIMQTEGGWNGASIKNKNGTEDLGVMQVNSSWLKMLKKHDISKTDLQFNPCTNVHVGTWILAKSWAKASGWQGVGNYHSETPRHNIRYREKVKRIYRRMALILSSESL